LALVLAAITVRLSLGAENSPQSPGIRFEDIAPGAGLEFVLHNFATPEKQMIETMAGGLAVFDYDDDGLPDIFFTNGASIPSLAKDNPRYWNRLFHNEGHLKFKDVTERARVSGEGYSMGAAAADYDNDGKPDLFVAGVNRNILYHNVGDGRFEDVTEGAGIKSGPWAVAAGWFDFDGDGLLDLWIVHYAKWSPAENRFCGDSSRGIRIYCHPKYFQPLPNTLYRNLGEGKFEDVSKKAGIDAFAGRGMSVVFGDYDNDGRPDVFVTNDNMPNFLFRNLGNGKFEETALLAGVALRDDGKPVASMGADFRDWDNDGQPDLIFTALAAETFPLFRNAGKGLFNDATYGSHLGALSLHHSGWGAGLYDFDNDGWKDLFTANSHVNDRVEQFEPAVYKETDRVFRNLGNGTWTDVSETAGLDQSRAHRGSAYADFDRDGKVDVVVSSLEDRAELWHNVTPDGPHWLNLKLIGQKSNRDAIGARVQINNQVNDMTSSVSYASSSLDGVHFGLANSGEVDTISIHWPSGKQQVLHHVKADQVLTVKEVDQ
jgi:enediyne biosynthesis protein E4